MDHLIALLICLSARGVSSTIRLVDGPTPHSGRVEVYDGGVWGTVCHRLWSARDASVVCRQLGYDLGGLAIKHGAFGSGEGLSILMAYVDCHGNEDTLQDCNYRSGRLCDHSEDAGVVCKTSNDHNTTGQTRLADGNTNTSGRVEIQYSGVWGSVCRDGWNTKDSRVVCRDMGYCGGSSVMHEEGAFGSGSGPVWLSDVTCSGTEAHLTDCTHGGWAENACEHYSDVGVVCEYCPTGSIRLVGSDNNSSGIVAISNSGVWGTICAEDAGSWSNLEARVVCRSLGFADGMAADRSDFAMASGPIWLSGLQCTGWESDLLTCKHDGQGGWGDNDCRHYQDVAVNCTNTKLYTTTSPRPSVSHTAPISTTTPSRGPPTSPQGQVSTTTGPEVKSSRFIIIIVSVSVLAIVIIVVVVAVVCGVTKVKTTTAKQSILFTPRGGANEYMVTGDVTTEGAQALALVPVAAASGGKRESGVYQEIDEKKAANGRGRVRNTYTDEPGAFPGPSSYRSAPLPSIPDDHVDTDQDNYAEIPDNNECDYLTPLKLRH